MTGYRCLAQALEHMRKRVSEETPRGRKERSWATGATAVILALMLAAGPQLLTPAAGAQNSCPTAESTHLAQSCCLLAARVPQTSGHEQDPTAGERAQRNMYVHSPALHT